MVGRETTRSPFCIGNCKVEIQGECLIDKPRGQDLIIISVSKDARIGISAIDNAKKCGRGKPPNSIKPVDIKRIDYNNCQEIKDYFLPPPS